MENDDEILSSKQHGHLVQQILDAQKEFSEVTGKTDIVSSWCPPVNLFASAL